MASVTHEHPTRSARLAEKPDPPQHAEELAHPVGTCERVRHRFAAAGVLHEAGLKVRAEPGKLAHFGDNDHLIKAVVAWACDHEPLSPTVKHECWLRAHIRALEESPVREPLVRDEVVLARSDKVRHRRIASIGADNE